MNTPVPEKLEQAIFLPAQSKDLDINEMYRQIYLLTKKVNEILDCLERKAEEV